MLPGEVCALCGENKATLFFQYFTPEGDCRHLGMCEECVEAQGVDPESVEGITELFDFGPRFEDGSAAPVLDLGSIPEECPKCGRSIVEVVNSGRVGCERCYAEYGALISQSLKVAEESQDRVEEDDVGASRQDDLRRQLAEAIADERYEDAARLRDALEEGGVDD